MKEIFFVLVIPVITLFVLVEIIRCIFLGIPDSLTESLIWYFKKLILELRYRRKYNHVFMRHPEVGPRRREKTEGSICCFGKKPRRELPFER